MVRAPEGNCKRKNGNISGVAQRTGLPYIAHEGAGRPVRALLLILWRTTPCALGLE
jgi:hypothetical protein